MSKDIIDLALSLSNNTMGMVLNRLVKDGHITQDVANEYQQNYIFIHVTKQNVTDAVAKWMFDDSSDDKSVKIALVKV